MSVWVQLAKGVGHPSNNPEKSASLLTNCRWELKLSSLIHGVKVAHLAAGWNRYLSSLFSGIIEGLGYIFPLELNKKEMSYFVWQCELLPSLPWQSQPSLSTEDALLLGSWSVTTYVFCFGRNWQNVAYALSLYVGTLKTEGREERGFRHQERWESTSLSRLLASWGTLNSASFAPHLQTGNIRVDCTFFVMVKADGVHKTTLKVMC